MIKPPGPDGHLRLTMDLSEDADSQSSSISLDSQGDNVRSRLSKGHGEYIG